MNGRYALDTNIVIAVLANDTTVTTNIATAREVFLPSTVLGELYYGAFKSAWSARNIARIEELAAQTSILVCDDATARYYGQIKNGLFTKGRPIPENDIWISALAQQYNLTLVTRDEHFQEVDGLLIERW
jgi:tRNA(fMet)-specific endonuclease VapC